MPHSVHQLALNSLCSLNPVSENDAKVLDHMSEKDSYFTKTVFYILQTPIYSKEVLNICCAYLKYAFKE